jgi:hypothetical protein
MKLDHLISHVKAPCDRCPYKQGLVQSKRKIYQRINHAPGAGILSLHQGRSS